MTNFSKKTAVILFNLGGPDSLEAVQPFLFNLFNDRAIISLPQPLRFFLAKFIAAKRVKKAQAIYAKIGGKSPLLDFTLSQAHELEKELSFAGEFKVFVAMRYWHPFADEVISQVQKYQPDQIILLPLYPQFSSATTDSSVNNFLSKFSTKSQIKVVCCYPEEPDFIKSHSLLIKQTVMKLYQNNLEEFRFLFSAHGLPQKLIDQGDPYVFHVTKTTEKIVANMAEILAVDKTQINFRICYQSKVGRLQWTSPSLDQEIKRAVIDKKIPVVVPVSFVSDHSETLVELDIDYKEMAQNLGAKNYLRVPALNVDGHFIKALAKICLHANRSTDIVFSGQSRDRICPKKMRFCPNYNQCQA